MVNIYEAGPFEGRIEQWPVLAISGALEVRLAETEHEIEQAQRLRYSVFYEEMSAVPSPRMREERRDFDKYDDVCDHLLVVDRDAHDEDGQPLVVGTYRLTREKDAMRAGGFYTASEYDLSAMLKGLPANTKYLELGRSCVLKSYRSRPGTMQLLWKGLMAYVARFDIDLMFGCASLHGTDVSKHSWSLAYLYHYHLAPAELRPRALDGRYIEMNLHKPETIDVKATFSALPPLFKGYLRLGAGIGDGAVIDHQFNTIDVCIVLQTSLVTSHYRKHYERSTGKAIPAPGNLFADSSDEKASQERA